MEAAGIEPASDFDATDSTASACENQQTPCAANALHDCGMGCPCLTLLDAELHKVIVTWAQLPTNIKRAIVTLIE